MEQRLSLITLGVVDLPRARAFYEALGWTSPTDPADDVAFFQSGSMVVALWSREALAEDSGVSDGGGWGGVTLAHNVRSPAEVDAVIDEAERAGATIARRGAETFWGGYSGGVHRPGRASVGGRTQPDVDDRRRRLDPDRVTRSPVGVGDAA
jgi:predicted lactoylglutathione lyase